MTRAYCDNNNWVSWILRKWSTESIVCKHYIMYQDEILHYYCNILGLNLVAYSMYNILYQRNGVSIYLLKLGLTVLDSLARNFVSNSSTIMMEDLRLIVLAMPLELQFVCASNYRSFFIKTDHNINLTFSYLFITRDFEIFWELWMCYLQLTTPLGDSICPRHILADGVIV